MSDYFNLAQGKLINQEERSSRIKKLLKQINKKTIFVFLIIVIAPLWIVISQQKQEIRQFASKKDGESQRDVKVPPKGYIIEFKTEPTSRQVIREEFKSASEGIRSEFQSAKDRVVKEHETAKKSILESIGKSNFDENKLKKGDKKVKILGEYSNVFNGIAIDADSDQIEKIKKSFFVKSVYANTAVKSLLMDSVPLVRADKVWQNFVDSKGVPLTGKGVNVAIIDTGIDYTHPDLGNSPLEERNFTKITTKPIYNWGIVDGAFSYDKGKIAYASGNDQVSIYSFESGQTENVQLNSPDITDPEIYSFLLRNNYLFYVSLSSDKVNLYMKNLTTGEGKKISDMGIVRSGTTGIASVVSKYSFTNGKLYYDRQTGRTDSEGFILFGTYVYDINTSTEEQILPDTRYPRYPKAYGNKLIYSVYDSDNYNYSKNVLRDLTTSEEKNISFPEIGPVIDFRNNLILTESYGAYGTYFLYDLNTEQLKKLSYSSTDLAPDVSKRDTITLGYDLPKGMIGDGVVFFQRNYLKNQLIAYDLNLSRYSIINLKYASSAVDGEGKKICFVSRIDNNIYCHDYDKNYSYPLPAKTYNDKVKGGKNFLDNQLDALDDNGHGTHVAEIVAGNGVLKGVAPDANLYAYKVLDSGGGGYFDTIISAIDNAVATRYDGDSSNDIDIINLSLGGTCWDSYSSNCGPKDPLSTAVNNASDQGIVVVVAAGNGGNFGDLISTPGTAEKAITVGSVNKQKEISSFSSRGPVEFEGIDYKKPDVVAPGEGVSGASELSKRGICSAQLFGLVFSYAKCFDDQHVSLSGTSMATPHVVGLAALLLQSNPDLTSNKIKKAIIATADNLGKNKNSQGSGLINAEKLISNYLGPTPIPTVTDKTTIIYPTADSVVKSEKPGKNFGTLKTMDTKSGSNISFMKFNLSALSNKKILSAKLVLKVNDASSSTQTLRRSDNSNWSETKINYNNRPKFNASISTFKAEEVNGKIQLIVTKAVTSKSGDSLTLGVTSSGNDLAKYFTRESEKINRPHIIILYQ